MPRTFHRQRYPQRVAPPDRFAEAVAIMPPSTTRVPTQRTYIDPAALRMSPLREFLGDEMRDQRGRWTTGGGGAATSPHPDPLHAHRHRHPPRHSAKPPTTYHIGPTAQALIGAGVLHLPTTVNAQLQRYLQDLERLPPAIAQRLIANNVQIVMGTQPLNQLPGFAALVGQVPLEPGASNAGFSRWTTDPPAGNIWISTSGPPDASSTPLHEVGHLVGGMPTMDLGRGPGSGNQPVADLTDAWRHIQSVQYSKLDPYYQQGGPGGTVGCQEMFAETFGQTLMNESVARQEFGSAAVDYVKSVAGL